MWGSTTSHEYLAKYPAHLTPMIEDADLPRGTLGESCAIMAYLSNKHGLEQLLSVRSGQARGDRQRELLLDRDALSAPHARDVPGARLPAVPGRGRERQRPTTR